MDAGFEDHRAGHSAARVCRADGRSNLRRHRCRHRFSLGLVTRCAAAPEDPVSSTLDDEDGDAGGGERGDDD